MATIKTRETMRATMAPDVYGGWSCDQVVPRWECYAEGDRGSDFEKVVTLDASTFPPGTKIVISEPLCPQCDELREPINGNFIGPCRCGFDWDKWTSEQFS